MQKIKNSGLALMGLAMLCMQATEALADCKPAVKAADKAAIASTYSAFQSLYGPYKSDLAATNAAQKAAIAKSNQYQAAKAKWIPVQKKCDAYTKDYQFYNNLCILAKQSCAQGVQQSCNSIKYNCGRAANDYKVGTPICNQANSMNANGKALYAQWDTLNKAYIAAKAKSDAELPAVKGAWKAWANAKAKYKSDGCV